MDVPEALPRRGLARRVAEFLEEVDCVQALGERRCILTELRVQEAHAADGTRPWSGLANPARRGALVPETVGPVGIIGDHADPHHTRMP
jgi:hypothetical protein